MRIVNRNFETITEYDLSVGRLMNTVAIKEDAAPIDNVEKFAWADEDYEKVQMYIPNRVLTAEEQILTLKNDLSSTDYQIIKCYEYQLLGQELPYNINELHIARQAIRDKINELEAKAMV